MLHPAMATGASSLDESRGRLMGDGPTAVSPIEDGPSITADDRSNSLRVSRALPGALVTLRPSGDVESVSETLLGNPPSPAKPATDSVESHTQPPAFASTSTIVHANTVNNPQIPPDNTSFLER